MMPKHRPVTVAKAHYTPSDVAMYAGNPLIEALPPRLGSKLLRQRLTVKPNSPHVGHLSLSEREESIHTLFDIRLLSQQHLDLYYDIYSMIRYGYVHRNPVRAEVVAWSYDIADPSVEQKEVTQPLLNDASAPTVADALFLTGFSGNGKSTMTEHLLLNLFPQVIEHTVADFDEPQVVYLKVDMPHNASRGGLISRVLTELDRVLAATSYGDPRYRDVIKKKNGDHIKLDAMVEVLITACNRHHLGLIVIDEFQNVKVASLRYRNEMLQLFDELANQLFIPSIKIGTPDTLMIFDNARHKRRLGKPFELNRLNEPKTWERLLTMLYDFQPLAHPITRDDKIDAALLHLTAAVPAFVLGLWEATLIKAIRTGKEKMSVTLIKQACRERFPLLSTATRNIHHNRRGGYADLLTVQQYLAEDNNALALKHLNQFAEKAEVKGEAASDVIKDIDSSFNAAELNAKERNKLLDIKKKLVEKSQAVLGPQTIEHKAT